MWYIKPLEPDKYYTAMFSCSFYCLLTWWRHWWLHLHPLGSAWFDGFSSSAGWLIWSHMAGTLTEVTVSLMLRGRLKDELPAIDSQYSRIELRCTLYGLFECQINNWKLAFFINFWSRLVVSNIFSLFTLQPSTTLMMIYKTTQRDSTRLHVDKGFHSFVEPPQRPPIASISVL